MVTETAAEMYIVLEVIGEGGAGKVHRVKDIDDQVTLPAASRNLTICVSRADRQDSDLP